MLRTSTSIFAAALVFGALAPAWAQAPQAPADQPATPAEDQVTPGDAAPGPQAVPGGADDTTDPTDPFAETGIDLSGAGTSVEQAQSFFDGLEPEQQQEVLTRCGEILASAPEVQDQDGGGTASVFCANLGEAGLVGQPAQ